MTDSPLKMSVIRITKYNFLNAFIIGALICACNHKKVNKIIVDNYIVEGNISKDTVYNGIIKFYDLKSMNLYCQKTYINNVLNGLSINYYDNGLIAAKENYENGKLNGYCTYYCNDINNSIKSKQYFYYDIKCGNSTDYRNGILADYYFYTLDNNLYYLNYDSLQGKKVTELFNNKFFCWNTKDYSYDEESKKRVEYFLYTPNPPNYNFRYSLVLIDKNYNVCSEIEKFDNNKPWSVFTPDFSLCKDNIHKIAIKLLINDPVGGLFTTFKILNAL